jgi:hypothetical protein
MREPSFLIIFALASMLVTLAVLGTFAQQDPPIVNPPVVNPPLVDLPTVAPPTVGPPAVRQPRRPQPVGGSIDATAAPPPPQQRRRAFYYRPGDLKGVPYDTIEGCTKAVQRAGDVGICVYK